MIGTKMSNEKLFLLAKEFIDDVGEETINNRLSDDLSAGYKSFVEESEILLKKKHKENKEIKPFLNAMKEEKLKKEATKQEKNYFYKNKALKIADFLKLADTNSPSLNIYSKLTDLDRRSQLWNLYEKWFFWAIRYGEDSYLATHIAKITHSSSKASSIDIRYFNDGKVCQDYLTTSLENIALDQAYPDNKYSSISSFYMINEDGVFIGDILRDKEKSQNLIDKFVKDEVLKKQCVEYFFTFITNERKKSFFLNKQIYFPVQTEQYHLLLPLISSSLAQDLHEKFQKLFSDEQKQAKEKRKSNKYSNVVVISYPNKAVLNVTQSNHSNASKLNGARGGRLSLLSCAPPQWGLKLSSYKNKNSLFDRGLSARLDDEITELRTYLLVLKNKELSLSKPQRNAAIRRKVINIISSFFDFVLIINSNESERGWTINASLPLQQQLLFEPWRKDDGVAELLSNDLWQEQLSKDFGRWLNSQLKTKKKSALQLTPIHEAIWSSWFLIELKEHVALQETMQ